MYVCMYVKLSAYIYIYIYIAVMVGENGTGSSCSIPGFGPICLSIYLSQLAKVQTRVIQKVLSFAQKEVS